MNYEKLWNELWTKLNKRSYELSKEFAAEDHERYMEIMFRFNEITMIMGDMEKLENEEIDLA